MWLNMKKASFHAHNGRPHFSLYMLINSLTNVLTFHACLSAKGLPVCFYQGLFSRPAWCPWMRGSSSWGFGWLEQSVSWLGMATRLDSDISHWFSNFLWNFQHNRASVGPTTITVKFLWGWCLPKLPPTTPIQVCLWYWWKNYLKWQELQLANHWRPCPMKYLV